MILYILHIHVHHNILSQNLRSDSSEFTIEEGGSMRENNIALRKWLADKERFADFINGTYFAGNQVICSDKLEQMDGENGIILKDKEGKNKAVQRFRDIIMKWSDSMAFVILAIENQEEVHYAMPIRNMLYDSLSYISQIEQLWKMHKKSGEKMNGKEFLLHLKKEDKLYPVITTVFYYGSDEWDASLDIHGMLYPEYIDGVFGQMKEYIPNYRINLIDAQRIKELEHFP